MYQAIVLGVSALLCVGLLYIFKGKEDDKFNKMLKILTVVYCAVGFCRFFLTDSFIFVINGGVLDYVKYDKTDYLQSIIRWGYYVNYSVLPMAVFYSGRLFKNIASYFCVPFTLLSAVFFDDFMAYFLEKNSHGYALTPTVRYIYFILELVLALIIPVLMQIRGKHVFNIKNKKEVTDFLMGLPLVVLICTPVYLPQSLFGYRAFAPKGGSAFHLGWLAVLFVVTIGLYYFFRFKCRESRMELCMFLAILLFFHHQSLYLQGLNITRLPFQLCNIAAYFYLIALVFKLEKFFHFAFIANIVGALIAILMPDFSTGAIGFFNMHYVIEHSLDVMVPAMVMGLRIFPRVEKRSLKYTAIGFTIYFVFVFILGTLFNGIFDEFWLKTGEPIVNYFFMFDIEKAIDFFPFLTSILENSVVQIGKFTVIPIMVGIIYVAFSLLCFVFYLVVRFSYKLEDDHLALRGSSIDLYEKLTHKTSRRPKQFID